MLYLLFRIILPIIGLGALMGAAVPILIAIVRLLSSGLLPTRRALVRQGAIGGTIGATLPSVGLGSVPDGGLVPFIPLGIVFGSAVGALAGAITASVLRLPPPDPARSET